jgi:hypothetical protein
MLRLDVRLIIARLNGVYDVLVVEASDNVAPSITTRPKAVVVDALLLNS